MSIYAMILIGLIALLHVYILWLEMFAWETRGPKVFKSVPKDLFTPTKVLAANQGLYNGFLVAGLVWSLLISDPIWAENVALFFSSCVLVAGFYGAYSAKVTTILYYQSIPAGIAILLLLTT
ncbi:DUF1304 domain-containing protein [Maritalea sp.]|jgi:putative membrane protein|uniref:DUF1304 domain-containing protein n=1 Tax=Maritalea sp. TaxID=2003361 RepID=UPI0039E351CC